MCTAITIHDESTGDYFMVFNRDELTSRATGTPPQLRRVSNGQVSLSPRDPDAGGTWIAVTDRGETFALLNNYAAAAEFCPRPPAVSRGAVIDWLCERATSESVDDVFTQVADQLPSVRPFRLLAHTPSGAQQWEWTGQALTQSPLGGVTLAISSGTHQLEAERDRSKALAELIDASRVPTWRDVAARMSEHTPPGPSAVCMHRVGGQTVSQTVVTVTTETVSMRYKSGAPCEIALWDKTELPRASHSPPPTSL